MPERSSNGKKSKAPATLDLMADAPAEMPPTRTPKVAPKASAAPAPADEHGALFGGEDVDLSARHPADVPVGRFPAPSQVVERDDAPTDPSEDQSDPFAEEDPFADTPMARMLADEPPPLAANMRAARERMASPVGEPPAPEAAMEQPEVNPAEQKEEAPMASVPAAPKPSVSATKSAPGLNIARRYTRPGENVWDTCEWELRTAQIVGSDGSVVFEQRGVEIPKGWSQLATNVVVSKYFRGHVGTLEREYRVKQLIGRVADRIWEWGRQGGYFASDEDAEAFHDELRYILLHQMAAFNSPVWFNLGWPGRKQAVSACYINEVDDTMESILDLYKTEGMLFKDGSGCTSGDALVYVRDAGFLPIRNLYKKFFAEGRPVQEFDGKGRFIEVGDAGIYTLSVNPDTGEFGLDQVLRVWQYDLPQEDKLTVRLDTGAKAIVSRWHPFLVWDGEKITHRRADQLRRGDAVIGPNATAQAAVPTRGMTFEYETTYFGRKESQTIVLDEDLAWLCGYFMGDGSLGAKQSRVKTSSGRLCTYDSLRLRFYDETEDTLRRVQQVIARIFGEHTEIIRGQGCPMLVYNGRRVTRFFGQLFGVGSKTYSLSIPAFVWNSPRAVQLAFLAGLIDSDGYIAEGGRANYSSASREFAGQVAALASFLGLGGGTVEDRHVTTATVLHHVASTAQRREFAAHLAHPERRRKLLETCSGKPQ
ncbi:MAG: hypothetical protein JO250_09785, partial [Armatimonadetes bacterium]|nr:hypothetical protein [Armatimonadota bacterium]